jgi:UDP-2,3-diacylglucosamine pyrophosphatase LpxH
LPRFFVWVFPNKGAGLKRRNDMKFLDKICLKRLSQSFEDNASLLMSFNNEDRLFFMSDCHRGVGDQKDNFAKNKDIYFFALSQYYRDGYKYIEIGDGDELWENKSAELIIDQYDYIFRLLNKFYKDGRMTVVYGNHDIVKRSEEWCSKNYSKLFNEMRGEEEELFPNLRTYKALTLSNTDTGDTYYVTHGHQLDIVSDIFWRLSLIFVRCLWGPLELIGIKQPTTKQKHHDDMCKVDALAHQWCDATGKKLILGHTHIPHLNSAENYYNDGSCVGSEGVNVLEIVNGEIQLYTWKNVVDLDTGTFKIRKMK